jgi:acyl-CoA synthetase (AMP-forming)/AMP-acid ligase II
MIELLEAAAAAAPEQTAVVSAGGTVSYGELLEQSRRVAATLRRGGITRFAVVEPDAAWVIRLLAGAAVAGAEPCQYQPDTDPSELAAQTAALGHTVVVTRREDLLAPTSVLRPEVLTDTQPDTSTSPEPRTGPGPGPGPHSGPGPQPLLIRTTGTTGTPKAARHDWRILTATVASVEPAPEARWLLAYGPHQFAGIQVLLHALASRATLVAPFPRLPKDCLQVVLVEKVTCVSATPTFWRFLLAEARSRNVELPVLQQITLGGEAVPQDLLDELRNIFPEANVSQVYASTEFGSITSVRDARPGLPLAALHSEDTPQANLRVEDGQLWVRAGAGMLGYVGELASASEGGGGGLDSWRPTGDLVEIVGDRVLFRGRDSEVINVGGVKVHPLPVEERILALPDVEAARVYGRPNKLTGAIVAVDIVPSGGVRAADLDKVRRTVKEAVANLPRAAQPRSVTLVDAIETRGGKTVRGTLS